MGKKRTEDAPEFDDDGFTGEDEPTDEFDFVLGSAEDDEGDDDAGGGESRDDDDSKGEPPTRSEKKAARGRMRDELEQLRKERDEFQAERQQWQRDMAEMRGRLSAVQTPQPQPPGEDKELAALKAEQAEVIRHYNARIATAKDNPLSAQEEADFVAKHEAVQDKIIGLRVRREVAKAKPSEAEQTSATILSTMQSEFPEEMKDRRLQGIAGARMQEAVARGKPFSVETAREIVRDLSYEFKYSKKPKEPSETERRTGRGVPGRGNNGGSKSVRIAPGSQAYQMAMALTSEHPDWSIRQRIQHFIKQTGYTGEGA